jgi:homoserine acetyltransferase
MTAPARGLAVARMIGHITYMSDVSMAEKFGRRVKEERPEKKFSPDFEVEGYLQYRGDNFVKRFDANSYLYITKAIDRFDLTNGSRFGKSFQIGIRRLNFWLSPLSPIGCIRPINPRKSLRHANKPK